MVRCVSDRTGSNENRIIVGKLGSDGLCVLWLTEVFGWPNSILTPASRPFAAWPKMKTSRNKVQNRNVIISVRSKKRKCEITKKAICMSFVLVIIVVALSLALYFKSKMHFQNAHSTDQSEFSLSCNETVPDCNGRIIDGTTTEHPPIHFAKKD